MCQGAVFRWEAVGKLSVSPSSDRPNSRRWFVVALFIVVFVSVRLFIPPIFNTDYINSELALRAILRGQSPFISPNWLMPPWAAFFLMPLVNEPLNTWLALTIALFVAISFDLGGPSALLLLAQPAFVLLVASGNPEWLLVGPGLWLLYRAKRGWLRGLAWLLLACKPQTTIFVLVFDGWKAFRARDWKAFSLSGVVALGSVALYPQFLGRLAGIARWSSSTLPTYGIAAAIIATAIILVLRLNRLRDLKTIGLMLGQIWAPYMLEYSYVAVAFTMRGAGWWRTGLYIIGSIGLAAIFWQNYHTTEAAGILGMTLLAALLAPAYKA